MMSANEQRPPPAIDVSLRSDGTRRVRISLPGGQELVVRIQCVYPGLDEVVVEASGALSVWPSASNAIGLRVAD
jgi:hypothetical protein